jgi:pimeloyl-[acyl-carrier protein] methyl ester esterase
MSYHPSLEATLDTPELRELKKQDFKVQRETFGKLSIDQINRLSIPEVITEKDIKLSNQTILRHYKPKQNSDKAVLFIHGGGWCIGSIDTYDHVCRYLCENGGFNIFSLDYRLAPEHPFPAALDDSLQAYDFLYNNSKEYGINPQKIFVMGDSAGGNLATIICHERQNNIPKAQILIYPSVDKFTKYKSYQKFDQPKYHLNLEWCYNFIKAYIPDSANNKKILKNPKISPIFYQNTKQPDTLIIAVTHDILIDGIYAYEKKLRAEGVAVETHYDDEMFHGFINTIGILPLENSAIALNKAIAFINKR